MTTARDTYLDLLKELGAIPSVSAKREHLPEAAKRIAQALTELGGDTTVDDSYFAPLVISQFTSHKADAKTLIIYNHYDVQPAEPFDLWDSDPWTLTERNGHLYGRGVDDDKGNLTARLTALAEYLDEHDRQLPVNILFVIEGSEETASQHLDDYFKKHPEIQGDLIIWESESKDQNDRPIISGGNKGIVTFNLKSKTAGIDLHSSLAAVVNSAAWRLSQALASFFDQDGHILVPHFYDQVRKPNQREKELIAALPETKDDFIKKNQIEAPLLADKRGTDWKQALYFEPTLNIEGITTGYQGAGVKTVLPAEATAKVEARLVPGMDPDDTLKAISDHLAAKGFQDIQVEKTLGQAGYRSDMTNPEIKRVIRLSQESSGKEPIVMPSSAGTGPMNYAFEATHAPIVALGIGYPGTLDHAPNENIRLKDYDENVRFVKAILESYQ
ncbi:M20/M25/M40 family metallo-hydrolase [Fructobacillus sp. M158]|uniref:M20/M25/M40 family metallo-hydrolase n=1 Tax=Fructobacillus parabroussonetiae TaxID=2713174 RepID=UPI00200A5461|nr:M20/M25/M40 family metallo-hydrolase [Fructobacillus parabroussonetiae]MCK8617585.1 M20/M25/M40 family metallo-hydrolase [Fructobacillus parabroussonetiae]